MKRKKLFNTILAVVVFMAVCYGFFSMNSDDNPLTATHTNNNLNAIVNTNNNTPKDLLVGAWTTGATIPTQDYVGGSVGYSRNDTGWLFVVTGNEPSAAGNIVMSYNFNTNTWATLAPLPVTNVANAVALLKDSVYSCGGAIGGATATANCYRYSINTNAWVQIASMPASGYWCSAVGYQDSIIYVNLGLLGGSAITPIIYMYNCNSNSWKTATPMPSPGRFACGFTRSGDTLVVIGGCDLSLSYGQTYVGVISQTDRSQITWSTKTSCPAISSTGIMRTMAMPWGPGKIIWANGSPSTSWIGSNYCYVYTLSTDSWTAQANKPTSTCSAMLGSVELSNGNVILGKLGCASGYTGSATFPNIEIYTDTVATFPVRPLCEGFNSTAFPPPGWNLTGIYWSRQAVSAFCNGSGSTMWDNFSAPNGIAGNLVTITFTPSITGDSLKFALAYCQWTAFPNDSLNIFTSTNGGTSYTNLVRMGETQMNTASGSCTHPFTPACTEWGIRAFLLPVGTNTVEFQCVSGYGDHVYIDSVGVQHSSGPNSCWGLVGIQNTGNSIPKVYSLSQNYPNPFNPTTLINYSLPKAGNVELKVFDVLGREVAVLVNEFKQIGNYSVEFNGNNFASGVYFYKITSAEFSETKKLVLLK